MSGTVVVVGSLNMDMTVRTHRLPRPGETVLATSSVRSGGGKGANQALAAARAGGARTVLIGAVGADGDGDELIAALAADQVDVLGVQRLSDQHTGAALITVDAQAENTIVVVAGANQHVAIEAGHRTALRSADILLAQLEVPQSVVLAAARQLRSEARLILNAAPSAPLDPELQPLVDLLVVNEHEAVDLAGEPELDAALTVLVGRFPAVLVTLGAEGARLLTAEGVDLHVRAPSVSPVDTVAAGDTFCGVLAAALAAGADERLAIETACAAASLATQRHGAQASIPSADETRAQASTTYG